MENNGVVEQAIRREGETETFLSRCLFARSLRRVGVIVASAQEK